MENVEIQVSVTSVGVKELDNVETKLTSLTKTTENNVNTEKKAGTALLTTNTSLSKQVPLLGQLNPLWSSLGISWLASGSAIAAVGVGAMMLGRTLEDTNKNIVMLGTEMNNQTIGPMVSYSEIYHKLVDLSLEHTISLAQLTSGMEAMNPKITDQAQRWHILNMSVQLHTNTGISVKDVVKQLSDAFVGDTQIRDKNTGAILLGNDALIQAEKNIAANETASAKFFTAIRDGFGTIVQSHTNWDIIWGKMKKDWQIMTDFFIKIWQNMLPGFKRNWDEIVKIGDWLVEFGKAAYAAITGPIFDWFQRGFSVVFGWIGDKISNLWGSVSGLWSKLTGNDKPAIASYATGTGYVPQTGPYILHQGEAVIPANQNTNNQTIQLIVDGRLIGEWFTDRLDDTVRLRGGY